MEAEIRGKLKLAFSKDLKKRYEFAGSIGRICEHFSQQFVVQQLIPFLTNWFSHNNVEEGIQLSLQMASIVKKAQSLVQTAPFIKVLLILENPTITKNILQFLSNYKDSPELISLIHNFKSTKFDCVRGFSAKVIALVESPDSQIGLVTPILADSSFFVRFSILKMVPQYPPEVAQYIIEYLIRDPEVKIRQYIPAATVSFDFFPGLVVPVLKGDVDWAVRAALASKASCFSMPEYVLNDIIELFNDGTWEVKQSSIKSLTYILANFSQLEIPQHVQYIAQMIAYEFPQLIQSLLANQTLDLVLELVKRGALVSGIPEADAIINTLLGIDISSLWSHLFKTIANSDPTAYAQFIYFFYRQAIEKALKSGNWRDRNATVCAFSNLFKIFNDDDTKQFLMELAKKLSYDEAFEVRKNASTFIAEQYTKGGNTIPIIVKEMKHSTSFRVRQGALFILQEMLNKATDNSFKTQIIAEIKSFGSDKFVNVSSLAESILSH
jgi:hypothetical protein